MYKPLQSALSLCLFAGVCLISPLSHASVQNKRFPAKQLPLHQIESAPAASPSQGKLFSTATQDSSPFPNTTVVRLSAGSSQIENALQLWSLQTLNDQTHRRGRSPQSGIPVSRPNSD